MIAIDVMGGDFAPEETVKGALLAARKKIPVLLCGHKDRIKHILGIHEKQWYLLPITILHSPSTIEMADHPVKSVLKKKDASLLSALQAVADGKASAALSAGNSGAALVAGSLLLQKVPGLLRPAIGNFLPTNNGHIFCLDLGANVDCKPEFLVQFALMGSAFVQVVHGIASPRVALLSNGQEVTKGSGLVKDAHEQLLTAPVNFIGNMEPRDIFDDRADVLVCDGFSGNIMLKAIEGTAQAITMWLKRAYSHNIITKLAGLANRFMLRKLKSKIDYTQKGGALLLGLKKPFIIAHGCSDAQAIFNAIVYAHAVVVDQTLNRFNERLEVLLRQQKAHGDVHGVDQSLFSPARPTVSP